MELPWGSLLEGPLRGEPDLYSVIRGALAPLGGVRIVLNARSLPHALTRDEAAAALQSALVGAGLADVRVERIAVTPDTAWGKRLSGGRPLEVITGEGRVP